MSISDATQAMFGRVYAAGKTKDEIINILNENAGTQFDPKLVNVLVNIIEKQPEKLNISYDEQGKIIYEAPTVEEVLRKTSKERDDKKERSFLEDMVKSEEEVDESYLKNEKTQTDEKIIEA